MIAQSAPSAHFRLPLGRGRMLSLTPGRPLLMGIVNVTPDSFSDGGLYLSPDHAVEQALRLIDEGADLIDLVRAPGRHHQDLVLGFDLALHHAYQRDDAEIVVEPGIDEDPDSAALAASSGCAVVLMHHHGIFAAAPRSRAERVVFEVRSGLDALVQRAVAAGCQRDQLVLDPGLGFGKVGGQNLELLRRLPELRTLDRPLLVGASRKSFLGGLAGPLEPPAERLEPSLAAAAWAAAGGAAVLRVHDVGATRKFLAAWTAIDSAGTGGPA